MVKSQKPNIVVTRAVPNSVADLLSENFTVKFNQIDKPFSETELKEAFQNFDGVLCTVSDKITKDILNSERKRASIISNYGVGVSNIDIECSKTIGLIVTNTPDVLTDSTAELALFLIIATSRRTSYLEAKLRKRLWNGFSIIEDLGSSLNGKTLGIIGMGRIGQATAKKAMTSLGMKVTFFNRSTISELDFDATQVNTLDSLLKNADVVSIHAPGGALEPILTEKHIQMMKRTAFLINTARGDVVDQTALVKALKTGSIAGAGLDVYLDEPNVPDSLLSLNNVTLLPHIGSATNETREAMGILAVKNLIAHFSDQNYPSRVV